MKKSRTIPLARGLIGGKFGPIYGQLEVFLTNYKNVKVIINRKPYSGHSDVKFSIACTDLQGIIKILEEAKKKLDECWLQRTTIMELSQKI